MIDEYQDTNHAQYLMAKYLAAASRNICVVGDDDQSIYSWRGADIRNILDFEHDYDDACVVTLEENYRSRIPILKAAGSLIKNNTDRKAKNIVSIKGEGEPITHCIANNEYGEAEFVISSIISLKNREGFSNKDFAVFYRTNAQSRIFEENLRKENIPYRLIGGLKFYDRKEIKDIVSYLRFIINPADEVSFTRIINKPARGIGKASLDKILETAKDLNKSPWVVVRDRLVEGRVPKGVEEFRSVIGQAMDMAENVPESIKLSTFVKEVVDLSGYKGALEKEDTDESRSRIDNIEEFLNSVFDYEITAPESGPEEFIQDISLLTSEENPEGDENTGDNRVTLMTVHNAKGLEFPVVFLTGLEEEMFPHKLSIDSEEQIEEERRLCYVGITRAEEKLFMTNAEMRRSFYGVEYKEPSRFLNEIPAEVIEFKNYSSEGFRGSGFQRTMRLRDSKNPGQRTVTPTGKVLPPGESATHTQTQKSSSAPSADAAKKISVKDRVKHPKYGTGLVMKIEGNGDNTKLTISFPAGKKTFLEKYTPLEKIG